MQFHSIPFHAFNQFHSLPLLAFCYITLCRYTFATSIFQTLWHEDCRRLAFPCIALHIIALRSIPFDAVHSSHFVDSFNQSLIQCWASKKITHVLSPKLPPHGGLELPSNLCVCRNCKPFSNIVFILYVYTYIRTYIHIAYYMYTHIYI